VQPLFGLSSTVSNTGATAAWIPRADYAIKRSILVNLLSEFANFEGERYPASTRRVYLSAAKKALRILGKAAKQCSSCDELLALLQDRRADGEIPNSLRLAPFLAFVGSKTRTGTELTPDFEAVRKWIATSVDHETRATRQISYLIRRDLAMMAGLCLAPDKGSPRLWPRSVLAVNRLRGGGFKVTLWDREVGDQGLALPLLYWHFWRERLARPEQGRLHRKERWAFSDLLFPNSEGKDLQSQVLHDALARMNARNEGPGGVTPALIQRAFQQVSCQNMKR
jgi:hypothetical protein